MPTQIELIEKSLNYAHRVKGERVPKTEGMPIICKVIFPDDQDDIETLWTLDTVRRVNEVTQKLLTEQPDNLGESLLRKLQRMLDIVVRNLMEGKSLDDSYDKGQAMGLCSAVAVITGEGYDTARLESVARVKRLIERGE